MHNIGPLYNAQATQSIFSSVEYHPTFGIASIEVLPYYTPPKEFIVK